MFALVLGNFTITKKPVDTHESRKAFSILKPAPTLDNSELTQSLAKLAEQIKQNMRNNNYDLLDNHPLNHRNKASPQNDNADDPVMQVNEPLVGQLLDIIQALELKLNSLQNEVHELQNNVNNNDIQK